MKNRITAPSHELASSVMCFIGSFISISVAVILWIRDGVFWSVPIIMTVLSVLFIIIGFLDFNRSAFYVSYDDKTKIVCRDGRLFGFHHEVKVKDIIDIFSFETHRIHRSKYAEPIEITRKYLIIVDTQSYGKVGVGRHSFIIFDDTEKNRAFLKQFWTKSIKHAKSKDIAKYIRKKPN